MPEDSKQMGARASNSPQLSIRSVRHVTTRIHDLLSQEDEECGSQTVPLGYVSEDDGDIEIGMFGSDDSPDEQH